MEALYQNRGYFELYGKDVVISLGIGAVTLGIVSYATYQSILLQIRANWNESKCNPIYMPFAGLIMPKPGVSTMDNTVENFSYCIKQDASMVFNIAMLPFEFCLYLVIEFMDIVMEAILTFMRLIQWLRDQLGKMVASLYNKLLYFVIPLIEMMIHVRDGLSKINGIALTTLFVTMTVFNTAVSGVINIMNILADLLIALIAVIVALMIIAFVLLVTPAFPVGITMYATGTAVLVSILIPTIILYVLMHTFTKTVMDGQAKDSPSPPSVKKRRR
jgi:hypothetical protein